MLILLSPSKTLDEESSYPLKPNELTQPELLSHSQKLAKVMKEKSADEISKLMKISEKLGELNYQRYQDFSTPFTSKNARPCIFTFKGDVYDGLDIDSFCHTDLQKAQKHLRILSGLYGVLRPFDLMQAYRLEMGIKLKHHDFNHLYDFWGSTITETLNDSLRTSESNEVINLASNEYFKAVKTKELEGTLITPVFKERKGNTLKVIGLFAKRARGMMAKYLLTTDKPLEMFNDGGYQFDETLSSSSERVFVR